MECHLHDYITLYKTPFLNSRLDLETFSFSDFKELSYYLVRWPFERNTCMQELQAASRI